MVINLHRKPLDMVNRRIKCALSLVLFSALSGCVSLPQEALNQPATPAYLKWVDSAANIQNTGSDELSLILTFSGGGTRAAAFSYGVLKELRDTVIDGRSMLGEVDVISSVSGGSFTAAYYGLFGERLFHDYESNFLKRPVQSQLIKRVLNPFNWGAGADRSDLVADYYDAQLFEKKQFRDLRPDAPNIVINATDLSAGTAFSFTPGDFNWICSDWANFSVGRAVVASSAVPVLFAPVTLENHKGCETEKYSQLPLSTVTRNDEQALGLRKYLDKERYRYLHLVDGGVADNLGIRSLLHVIAKNGNDIWQTMQSLNIPKTKNLAFIVVNAADAISPLIAQSSIPPAASATMGAVSTIQVKRYNADTLDLLTSQFPKWTKQVITNRCGLEATTDCGDIEFSLAELNFNQLPRAMADKLSLVETSLELNPETVDLLIEAGRMALRESREFQQLLTKLRAS